MGKHRQGTKNKKQAAWPDGHRVCVSCEKLLPFSMFHTHSACLFGINTICKECRAPLSKNQWKEKPLKTKILQRAKTRAVKQNIEFSITEEDIYIPEKCPVFNTAFIYNDSDLSASIDKINPELGYIKGNIRIISNKANRMKSNASYEDLLVFSAWIQNTK